MRLFLSLLLLFAPAFLHAADEDSPNGSESRPVTGIYSLELGHKDVLATYLSPLHYNGLDVTASGEWSKAMPFAPKSAIMHFDASLDFSNMMNPAETARMVGLQAAFKWGMSWRTMLPYDVQMTLGGTVGFDGGAYYLLRNGNNPVQALGNVAIAARASLARPFKIGRLNVLLRDVVSLPTVGAFFCQDYGETYYEIYLGNHKGLVHAGWWGNNFRIDNLLSATLDFGRTAMQIGYRFRADTQWANKVNTKIFTHSFVIGIIPGGIGLKKAPKKVPDVVIQSLY